MRIGIDARFFGPKGKGLGRYTQKLIENLERIDKQNQYFIFLRDQNWDLYQPGSPNFKKILADYRWYSLKEQILMPFKIYQTRVDLMHFPHFNVPIFYFGKFIVTIHDLILRHFPTRRASTLGLIKYWLKSAGYRVVIRFAIARSQKIITVSDYVKKDITKCFDVEPGKITVTHEGAPEKKTEHGVEDNELVFNERKIRKPFLLYVGNAYPHKNLVNLIRAFEILIRDFKKDLSLVLVGEDDYFYQRLKKESNTIILASMIVFEKIIFTGFVNDENLNLFYKNAALYVFPSLCEGFGLPPLEAMAYGVPVVCSDATCLPEILGKAAIYFNALDPRDVAEKIKSVLIDRDLRNNLVAAGYEQIKKYSWQEMAKKTQNLYINDKIG